jgi:tRNA threonylcarbamoyladenosine biosynthesis protein TsaE
MKAEEFKTNSLNETYKLAADFCSHLASRPPSKNKGATVVGLFGNLGAGKTSFTQGIAKAFGIKDHITSPTFVLEKIYKLKKGFSYEHLVHIDAYRLEGAKEMSAIGWDEIRKNRKNIVFIEWPENVKEALPEDMIKVYFEAGVGEQERKIKIIC